MIIDLKSIKKVYINLDRDVDRKNKFENIIKELQYTNIDRFSARLLPKIRDFNHGCSQSHHDLMNQYKNELPLFLMEDDAKPTKWYDEYVNDGKIEVPDGADVIYIGFSTAGCWKNLGVDFCAKPYNEKWVRLKHCLGTHAMIFLNNNIQKFIENSGSTIQRKVPLDIGYAKEVLPNLKIYAPKKSLFYQWDKCWITTNTTVDVDNNKWTSHNEDGTINFIRDYINA
jgi:hypothetical protein